MSSIPEPLRPAYATGDSAAVGAVSRGTGASGASSAKTAASRSKKTVDRAQGKVEKSSRKSAKRLMKAAYEPLRRAVTGNAKGKEVSKAAKRAKHARAAEASGALPVSSAPSEDRRTRSTVAPIEVIEMPSHASASVLDTPAAPVTSVPVERSAAEAEEVAAVIAAAANVSTGLAVVTQSEADRLKTAEAAMRESLQKYQAAMRQMEVRFEVLDRDISLKKNRNPIHHIESRIKKPASIFEKLQRQGFPMTIESMEENLFDIAGVRVICSYIHDVYSLLDLMKKQDDLEVVTIKDYIANPKPNGYRSLHVIVRIPVYFMDKKEMVPVEVQLRTIAMDFWASLEHSLKYKAVREVQGIDASDELKDCSRIIEDVEARMQILAKALEVEE